MSYGPIARGTTSKTIGVRILDTTSVVGAGKTGLVFNSTNLTCYYKRQLDTVATAISLITTTVGVWASGGFVEIDSTHMAGQYELGLPNTAIGSGDASTWVEIYFYDAGSALGIPQTVAHIPLWAADPQDATRLGLTALPNANAGAVGGLPELDSNSLIDVDIKRILATASAGAAGYLGIDWAHINAPTTAQDLSGTTIKNVDNAIAHVTTVDGNVIGSVGSVVGNVGGNVTGSVGSVLGNVAGSVASVVGNVGGNVVGSVGGVLATVDAHVSSIANGVIAAATFAANALDSVWDAITVNHTLAGSFGLALGSGSSSPSAIATAVWAALRSANIAVGSMGEALVNIFNHLSGSPNAFISPVNISQTEISVIAGNAYEFAVGTQLPFTSPWASLSFSAITFYGQTVNGATLTPIAGTMTDTTHGYVELTPAQSAQLVQGTFSVIGTTTTGSLPLTWAWGVQNITVTRNS